MPKTATIWQIYANNFGPDGFDASIDLYTATDRNRTFVLFEGDELAGMSSFLGIDQSRGSALRSAGPTIALSFAARASTGGSRT